jgi:hypothetical protein
MEKLLLKGSLYVHFNLSCRNFMVFFKQDVQITVND